MARSDIVTMIPLDRAAKIIGIDPYHFNSITTLRRPENNACDDIWMQYSEQRQGQLGRDDLAFALKQAEDTVTHYLGYFLVPQWTINEEKIITKPASPDLINIGALNARGMAKSVILDHGYVIEGGQKTKSLISAGVAIVYSDDNGDGYRELCTVIVPTTVTDPQEVHVYFPGKSGSDKWEVRPVDVSLVAGNAIITFPRYLVPLPNLWTNDPDEGDHYRTINGDDINAFLTTVDIYRVFNDPQSQAIFYTEGTTCVDCGGNGCPQCGWTTQSGCIRVRDSRRGIVSYAAATWNTTTNQFDPLNSPCPWYDPDKVFLWYRSGLINNELDKPYLEMEPSWERMIVYYALTLLDRQLNGCENTRNIWKMMDKDMSESANGVAHQIVPRDLGNPLGPKYAAIRLWRMIESNRLMQGR